MCEPRGNSGSPCLSREPERRERGKTDREPGPGDFCELEEFVSRRFQREREALLLVPELEETEWDPPTPEAIAWGKSKLMPRKAPMTSSKNEVNTDVHVTFAQELRGGLGYGETNALEALAVGASKQIDRHLIDHGDGETKLNDNYNIGMEDVSIACVQMLGVNSSDKAEPIQHSQAVRRNVTKGSKPNLKRLEEVVQKLDKVPAEVNTFLHLLESTNQEQQHELYKACETRSLPRKDLINRGKDKEFVMQWLRKPSNEHPGTDLYRNISLLSIVEPGGMGKATVLQHVYEDEMTEEFDLKMWVCIYNNFDVKKIIADMLESLKTNRHPLDTLYALSKES
ncbi:hypothetical protein IEQ34_008104 [Dendrobium chrysotoxum]|uniref:NB-ARC domain-containing protein n=1 Tax=Dendrobium chrysotoxum TaxID=161865 RepID=A0AAV7H585_DENCH|nr:hypothetical protein IEQ34_008104 [Dendrobium chrysotoxum]